MTKLLAPFASLFLVFGIQGHSNSKIKCYSGDKVLDTIQKVATQGRNHVCGQCPTALGRRAELRNSAHLLVYGFAAFAASLSKNYQASGDRKVVFDQIQTNIGHHYNGGVFTAPTKGVYYFDWTITTVHGGDGDSELMVNNIMKRRNACDSKSGGKFGYRAGSASIVLQLKRNDKVWIRLQAAGCSVYGSNWSSFQGWLLKHM